MSNVQSSCIGGYFYDWFMCFEQVAVWGECCLANKDQGNDPDAIQLCSSILDVGDSVTALGISHILAPDGRYIIPTSLGKPFVYMPTPSVSILLFSALHALPYFCLNAYMAHML